jgi:hypothetical protein
VSLDHHWRSHHASKCKYKNKIPVYTFLFLVGDSCSLALYHILFSFAKFMLNSPSLVSCHTPKNFVFWLHQKVCQVGCFSHFCQSASKCSHVTKTQQCEPTWSHDQNTAACCASQCGHVTESMARPQIQKLKIFAFFFLPAPPHLSFLPASMLNTSPHLCTSLHLALGFKTLCCDLGKLQFLDHNKVLVAI